MKIKIHCDGGSRGNPGAGASAFVVYGKDAETKYKAGKVLGVTTNNVAEYNGVLDALDWLIKQKDIEGPVPFFLDSQLVVNQLKGVFKIKDKNLLELAKRVKILEQKLSYKISYNHVFRNDNKDADLLVNQTLDNCL